MRWTVSKRLPNTNSVSQSLSWEYPRLCVWVLAHAIKTGHLLNRSGYRIANWFRAATHSLTQRPFFSKLRMAR